jgi:hypothetical protein
MKNRRGAQRNQELVAQRGLAASDLLKNKGVLFL